MRKLNIPSYNILIPREKRIRAIQELYDVLVKFNPEFEEVKGTMPEGNPPTSEYESDEEAVPPYLAFLPKNGANYHLGEVEGVSFSNDLELMISGCTFHFTATVAFDILTPIEYTDEDSGETFYPLFPVKIAGDTVLHCEAGKEYMLSIIAINGGSTGINVMNLVELNNITIE